MEYDITKKLVNNNFVQVLVDSDMPEIKELIPLNEPLQNCLLTILSPTNKAL